MPSSAQRVTCHSKTNKEPVMTFETVAIIAQGDMGAGTGAQLVRNGLRVVTNLSGRSERSHMLAKQAGLEDVGEDNALIREADIFLSILPPGQAVALGQQMAPHIKSSGKNLIYADCNAIAPATAQEVQAIVEPAGARFVDVGIFGNPPTPEKNGTRYYASGPDAAEFGRLRNQGLTVIECGAEIGRASAIKMCFASVTKTMIAMMAETVVAAKALGVYDEVVHELSGNQTDGFNWAAKRVISTPPKAYRWVAEVEEIGKTFETVGLPGATCTGGAEMFQLIADSPLGEETVENRQRGTTLEDCAAIAADYIGGLKP
ncbi:MAG TPA: 6-phosphogluconate dehydrogenase [Rhodospirillaceae bacterium]|nr:6-phosphogluconate dehydrogenase [Rhodospirillaceae bacterium]